MKECMGKDNRKGRKTRRPSDLPSANISICLSLIPASECRVYHLFSILHRNQIFCFFTTSASQLISSVASEYNSLLEQCHHPNLQDTPVEAASLEMLFPRSNLLLQTHKLAEAHQAHQSNISATLFSGPET